MREKKTCAAVIVAAGSARRMQGIDKAMEPIGGVPMLVRTVRAVAASEKIDRIVIVTREDLIGTVRDLCVEEPKVTAVVAGGDNRAQSVQNGLAAVGETDLIAIHDGARPLVTTAVIAEAVVAAEQYGAAAPAVPVTDTVKVAKKGIVEGTPDRRTLFAVQTPQVFRAELIRTALQTAIEQNLPITDDCSAAELSGAAVHLTAGSTENLKVTVPLDMTIAEAILKRRGTI